MRSIFGWSYPPGCHGPPEEYEGPCEVCGKHVDDCICPECPVCKTYGDPLCYNEHGLVRNEEQITGKKALDEYWDKRIKEEEEFERRYNNAENIH